MTTFQVQIRSAPGTRWLSDDEEMRRAVQTLVESVVRIRTQGPEPRCVVTVENCVCEICEERKRTR
jgi:hypothetical protein